MSESSDTSAIDKKKEESSTLNKNFTSDIVGFLSSIIYIFIYIAIYYSESGLLLYACKLAQSNILPTNVHCLPYTDTEPNIQPIKINIFTTGEESMKINFPYNDYNSKNFILDMFREYKNEPTSNFLANYLISIVEPVIQFNYSAFNAILNILNGAPEIIIILFGPIIFFFISIFLLIIDHIYVIYLWFAQMGWFLKTNSNYSGVGNPEWDDVTLSSPFYYLCGIVLVILFIILFFFSLPIISIIVFFAMLWCILSGILYQSSMNNKNTSAISIIQDTFKYYKTTIMGIFSFFVILNAFFKLGFISGIFSIIVLALICFGIISIDLFKTIHKDNLSPLASFNQAKKTCSFKAVQLPEEEHGILYNLLFGKKKPRQKGGNIIKEIKTVGKRLSRN